MKTLSQKAQLAMAGLFFKGLELKRRLTQHGEEAMASAKTAEKGKIYSFTMKTIDGKDKPLSDYKGRVLVVVNTASLCGFTPQYDSLQALYEKYKDQGLRVLAFPANEFGKQEPGSDSEIQEFCRTRYSVGFDLFSKIVVKGEGIHPLYRFLTQSSGHNGEISWNFTKFLVSKDGTVAARFDPTVDPVSAKFEAKVSELLGA